MRGGCETMHVQRALLERMTGTGWSLGRLADRVLRTPARFTVSGRRIKMTTGGASGALALARLGLRPCTGPPVSGAAGPETTWILLSGREDLLANSQRLDPPHAGRYADARPGRNRH